MKTIDEIRDAFHHIHHVALGTSDRAYMSIPADPERDADLIVSAAIDELKAARDRIAALSTQKAGLVAVVEEVLNFLPDPSQVIARARAALAAAAKEEEEEEP